MCAKAITVLKFTVKVYCYQLVSMSKEWQVRFFFAKLTSLAFVPNEAS
jgi:hypothetical protein